MGRNWPYSRAVFRAYENPNVVKVVVNSASRALYFSRRTIPFVREAASRPVGEQLAAFPFLKHLGIYGYRRETLLKLVQLPVSPFESEEKLEQLRALENGIEIAGMRVLGKIQSGDATWEAMVPKQVAKIIKERRLLGWQPKEDSL